MRIKQHSRRLQFEGLETRRMLDGVINTSFQNGLLTLTGDDAANAVFITSPSAGVVKIFGVPTTDSSNDVLNTKINTSTDQSFLNVRGIVVNFNDGAKGINAGDDVIYASGLTLPGGLAIQTGDGTNTYTLGVFDNSGNLVDASLTQFIGPVTLGNGTAINMGAGDNTLVANQLTLHGSVGNNLTINAGNGTNTFTFDNTTDTHAATISETGTLTLNLDHFSAANLAVTTGIDNDNVTMSNTTITGKININTNFGNDAVNMTTVNAGSFDVALGVGNDHVTASGVNISGETTIHGGTNDDTISLTNFNAGSLGVFLDAGNDTATLNNVTVNRGTTLDGSDGMDTITATGLNSKSLLVAGGNGIDNISLTTVNVTKAATINAGVGNDIVNLNQITAATLNTNLGDGADQLTTDTVNVQNANLDGGTGDDNMQLSTITATANLSVTLDKGNDSVTATHLSVTGAAVFVGAQGNDTYTDGGSDTYGTFTPKSIENMN